MKIKHILFVGFCLAAVLGACRLLATPTESLNLLDVILAALCAGPATMSAYIYVKTKSSVEICEWELHEAAVDVGSCWFVTMWVVFPVAIYVFVKSLTSSPETEPPLPPHP